LLVVADGNNTSAYPINDKPELWFLERLQRLCPFTASVVSRRSERSDPSTKITLDGNQPRRGLRSAFEKSWTGGNSSGDESVNSKGRRLGMPVYRGDGISLGSWLRSWSCGATRIQLLIPHRLPGARWVSGSYPMPLVSGGEVGGAGVHLFRDKRWETGIQFSVR